MAVGLNYSIVGDAPAGGPGASALRLQMNGSTTAQTTQCVRSQFTAPLGTYSNLDCDGTATGDFDRETACFAQTPQ